MRIKEYVKNNPQATIFLIERSVISDKHLFAKMLQESGCFTPLQTMMYNSWSNTWDQLLPFQTPTAFLYLAPSVKESLKRIKARNRLGETVSEDYQQQLHEKHEKVFGQGIAKTDFEKKLDTAITYICHEVPVPVLRLYTDDDYRTDDKHPIFSKIIQFINLL